MISFQQATSKDANTIATLHTKSWQNTYRNSLSNDYLDNHAFQDRQAVWQKRFEVENSNQVVLIAKDNETLAAFVCLFVNYDKQFGSYLDNLHVDSAYQNKGLGKQLIQHAVTWLVENTNNEGMFLWVFEANHNACRFYEKLGGFPYEVSNELMPDGNRVVSVRYVWKDVSVIYL